MAKRETKKIEFILTLKNLELFISKLVDLAAIDDFLVLKVNNEDTIIYSAAYGGNNNRSKDNILAFKNYIFKTQEIFTINTNIDREINFIIKEAKKTIKNLKTFMDLEIDELINCRLSYDELNGFYFGDSLLFKNSKLKLDFPGGSPIDTDITISKNLIERATNKSQIDVSFVLTKDDFIKAKKMSYIEKDNEIIYFTLYNNEIRIGENRWSLKLQDYNYIEEIKDENGVVLKTTNLELNASIHKKYFKTITCGDAGINVDIYATHLLLNNNESTLLISRQSI
jgi:hypothetical protein